MGVFGGYDSRLEERARVQAIGRLCAMPGVAGKADDRRVRGESDRLLTGGRSERHETGGPDGSEARVLR